MHATRREVPRQRLRTQRGRATASAKIAGTSSELIALGWCGVRRSLGKSADKPPELARATTATVRRKLITVPARVATSARRIILHLPQAWPWETAWTALLDRVSDPPAVRET